MFKTIVNYAKEYKLMFAVAEICIIILYVISLILPWNLTRLVDRVIVKSQVKHTTIGQKVYKKYSPQNVQVNG